MEDKLKQSLLVFEEWYKSLKIVKANGGPANGTIAAALVILENLQKDYNLNFESHLAPGGAQIKGASGAAVAAILKRFGETRPFAKEGGRTNRGGQGDIKPLFEKLAILKLEELPKEDRNNILIAFQAYLVENGVIAFHNRQKIKISFDHRLATRQLVQGILEEAKKEGKAGPVAQHLVGAKLQLRFPDIRISNESASTADRPTNRQGDFLVGDTVFHVTVAPMHSVFEKCKQNIAEGFKVYVLIPDYRLPFARELGELHCNGHVAVESVESFVSQNIEEISLFNSDFLKSSFTRLIELYNERVDQAETDKSLMIELPSNLRKRHE